MIDKSKRKATAEQAGSVIVVRMTGGPDCLWLNMYLDTASWLMVCDSDIGSYAYRWGRSASRNETFLAFCCRWLSNGDWLLRKCVGERHVSKEFLRDKAEAVLREMVIEYNAGDDDFDEDCLDDMMGFAAGYDSEPKAWALAIQTYADARGYDLPEEWYECIEEDYTPWQKRFAEICRDVIVPVLERFVKETGESHSPRLKPCPFCGYKHPTITYSRFADVYTIACPNCQVVFRNDCTAGRDGRKEKTADAWNRRNDDGIRTAQPE